MKILLLVLLILSCTKTLVDPQPNIPERTFYYVNNSSHEVVVSIKGSDATTSAILDSVVEKGDTVQVMNLHQTEPFGGATVTLVFDTVKCLSFDGLVVEPTTDIRSHLAYRLVKSETNENFFFVFTDSLYNIAGICP